MGNSVALSRFEQFMRKIVIFIFVFLSQRSVSAEYPQIFIGIKGGEQWAQDENYKYSNPRGTVLGVLGGVELSPSWSWDVGYQYHDELKADATLVNVETWLVESALRYDWYLQNKLSLYGRLGATYWDLAKVQHPSTETHATGFSPLGEVGVNYSFNSNVRLSVGYQYIDSIGDLETGKYDSHGLLVGLTYTFSEARESSTAEENLTSVREVTAVEAPQQQTFVFSAKNVVGLFGFDSIECSPEFRKSLKGVAAVLSGSPQFRAVVIGHADSVGAKIYNQALSEKRAEAAVNRLIELGVNPSQLKSRGEGESRPIADDKTVEGRAQNRRVEVIIDVSP